MRFAEADGPLMEIPAWASWLIRFGYTWSHTRDGRRRIALLSLPCDSGAAGLVALGAMCQRLTIVGANDLAEHKRRVWKHVVSRRASPLLKHIRGNDHYWGLGPDREPGWALIGRVHADQESGSPIPSNPDRWPAERIGLREDSAELANYYFKGEAPVKMETLGGVDSLRDHFMSVLIDGERIVEANLRCSDSGACLAGRSAGKEASQKVMKRISFVVDGGARRTLNELLSVQGWGEATRISRMNFFNPRMGDFDRQALSTSTVVADGHGSFREVLGRKDGPEFATADIIAVIDRVLEREQLEAVSRGLTDLNQWYEDVDLPCATTPPPGMACRVIRTRSE